MARTKGIYSVGRDLLLLAWTAGFVGRTVYEWSVWPESTLFFGPFWFVRSHGLDVCSGLSLLTLITLLFSFPLKPGLTTAVLSALGFSLWVLVGFFGWGTGV